MNNEESTVNVEYDRDNLLVRLRRRLLGQRKMGRLLVMMLVLLLWGCFWVGSEITLWSTSSSPLYSLSQQKIFIAANFYNNEDILANFSEQLLKLVKILKSENVYVSIFENGSKDNTKSLLHALQFSLNATSIANTIITDNAPKSFIRKISYLADLRNKVLEPLLEQAEKGINFDKILFSNDAIWTVSDILTLLGTNGYSFDAACAMDFYWTYYDTFATRELLSSSPSSSNMSYPWHPASYYPYFFNTTAQQQVYNGDPVQMFSCWNGVVILNAEPFVKHGVKFRALVPDSNGLPFEASECCLVYSDFRKLGYDKIFINPNVRVSYEYRFYLWSNYLLPLIDRVFFQYFSRPAPPSLFSDEGMQMQEVMREAEKLNVTELDRVCVQ